MSDVNGNLTFGLGQIQNCGGVESVKGIPTIPSPMFLTKMKDIKENS